MTKAAIGWQLIIERGREPGRAYVLAGSALVLGAAPEGTDSLPLADQEGTSPKRMAARQAILESKGEGWSIRDLESPGGTFVNRQRVLPGQSRPLSEGDIIQLGAVQLKLNRSSHEPLPAPKPPQSARWPLVIAGGLSCRSWDEILPVSSQRWSMLRDELLSGELATKLTLFGRPDLAPAALKNSTPDERLDAWLKSLPTSQHARAELEVHPERILISATPGSSTLRKIQVSNVGYGLLKVRIRVEPSSATWLKILPPFDKETIVVESLTATVSVSAPEQFDKPLQAILMVEGPDGPRRVEVVLEIPTAKTSIAHTAEAPVPSAFFEHFAKLSRFTRTFLVVGIACGIRLGLALGNLLVGDLTNSVAPGLRGPILIFAILGAPISLALCARNLRGRDLAYIALGGSGLGVITAVMAVAIARTIEPLLGSPQHSVPVGMVVWLLLGLGIGLLISKPSPISPGEKEMS